MKMKRLLPLLLVLVPLLSCNKESAAPSPEKDIAFVSIRPFETRSQIGTNTLTAWSKGDAIAIVSDIEDTPSVFTLRSGAGYSSASFEGVKPEGNLYVACYPSTARCNGITYRGLLDTKVTHTMPSQTLGALPMWGRGSDLSSMTLSPICGIFQLNLTGTGKLSSILLDAGRPVSGEYLCSLSDGLFAMINGSDIVLMDVKGTELSTFRETPFYFILPPGEYEGLRLTITAEDGTVKEQVLDETLVIEAGLFSLVYYDFDEIETLTDDND